ncbi:endonuclease [Dyella jejuensis]|uniref:Endonuclease n=2 Tax=Dyella jejuensis TaxID=1432009 RepID=A0ABW8JHU7_9GAMM
MPEGPSIAILRDEASIFVGKRVRRAHGNAKIAMARIEGACIVALRSFGKQTLIQFDGFFVRVHLLMFGSYRINEQRDIVPRLGLVFAKGELNFYNCSVKLLEGDIASQYDWRIDIMSDQWDARLVRKKLRAMPEALICDALLDQDVFAGVGNIIKNEVLFLCKVHPLSRVGDLPPRKSSEIVAQAREYSFRFLDWKKAHVLRKHWLVHNQGSCPIHHVPLTRGYLGKRNRRSFFCELCQRRYGA